LTFNEILKVKKIKKNISPKLEETSLSQDIEDTSAEEYRTVWIPAVEQLQEDTVEFLKGLTD
jgi:hypothetical protein